MLSLSLISQEKNFQLLNWLWIYICYRWVGLGFTEAQLQLQDQKNEQKKSNKLPLCKPMFRYQELIILIT